MKSPRATVPQLLIPLLLCVLVMRVPAEQGTVLRLQYVRVDAAQAILAKVIRGFEATNPGVRVALEVVRDPREGLSGAGTMETPDVAWVRADDLQELAAADAIQPLGRFLQGADGLPEADRKDIPPGLWQMASAVDPRSGALTLYALPLQATTACLVYNKNLLRAAGLDAEEPPLETWDQCGRTAGRLTDKSRNVWGFFIPVWGAGPFARWFDWQFRPFLWAAGGRFINAEGTEVLFNGVGGRRAARFWRDLRLRYEGGTTELGVKGFLAGKVGMVIEGPWRLRDLQKVAFKWGVALMPKGPKYRRAPLTGECLAIPKRSAHAEAAWRLIKFWTSPAVQAEWAASTGYLPVRQSVLEESSYQDYCRRIPGMTTFVEELQYAYPGEPIPMNSAKIIDTFADAVNKIVHDGGEVEDILDRAAAVCNRYLRAAASSDR